MNSARKPNELSGSAGQVLSQGLYYLVCLILLSLVASRLTFILENSSQFVSWLALSYTILFLLILTLGRSGCGLLFLVVITFGFFGNQHPSVTSQLFDLVLALFATCFWLQGKKFQKDVSLNFVSLALLSYLLLVSVSLVKLPLDHLANFYSDNFFSILSGEIHGASVDHYLYSVNSALRLWTMYFLILGINHCPFSKDIYRYVFLGLFASAILVAGVGLLDFYGQIDLSIEGVSQRYRLHSVFLHPGWFAEFIILTAPFGLILFTIAKPAKRRWINPILIMSFVLFSMVIVLAQARAGWVIYLLVLAICLLVLISASSHRPAQSRRRNLIITAFSIPLTLILAVSIILILNSFDMHKIRQAAPPPTGMEGYVMDNEVVENISIRSRRLFNASDRLVQWQDGYQVARENPLSGLGYESYRWFANLLGPVEGSYLHKYHNQAGGNALPTPHNFYMSLFVSNGVIGVLFWLLIVAACALALSMEYIQSKNMFAVSALISILGFHLYGIFQSMQYIVLIHGILFLVFGYAMLCATEMYSIQQGRFRVLMTGCSSALVILICSICSSYIFDRGSPGLASRYDLELPLFPEKTAGSYDFQSSLGFHRIEMWDDTTMISWSKPNALILTELHGPVSFPVYISHPDVAEFAVTLEVFVNDSREHVFTFVEKGVQQVNLNLPDSQFNVIRLSVSRGFRTIDFDGSDSRLLGVAVGKIVR